jgi:serine phosphatase RsbU (regulator of sigma subunit)/anti-sigma regulatory factor (Ser/Thr protein kinase)/anti-anti-sigma regulatory factor
VPGTAHEDDTLGRLAGDAAVVRDAFEQLPAALAALDGPDHRLAAMNAAYRAFTGRAGSMGVAFRDAFPELAGQQLFELLDRVYATGEPETGTAWRVQLDLGPRGRQEIYADFTVTPRRAADGAVNGLLIMAADATERVARQRSADAGSRDAERRGPPARGIVAELQEALLPTALPVLPRARIAARYLVAGQEQAAGGDWFDAIPLDGGCVALVVGDVVGHGVAASAAMGQLRAVLAELLAAEPDLAQVLRRTDAFAARMPALRAATLALAVLDPATGTLRYTTCGHPPPLVISADGAAGYLEGIGTGPLGTGAPAVIAESTLVPGELVLLYSDGLVDRPDRPLAEGLAELALVAADAAANRTLALGADPAAAERVCQLTVELLTRTGHADDVTALAAQRLAEPVPPLHLALPGQRPSLTTARDAFADWLGRLDAAAEDWEALHLAMVEVFTNAIEHAYPRAERGTVELDAWLGDDGNVECRVTDHGTWRRPDPADPDRGHGLMVAGQVVDTLLVSHPSAAADDGPDDDASGRGTIVTLRHRLRRPAILASGHHSEYDPPPAEPPFTVDTSTAAAGTARALVGGPVNITTADQLSRRLLSVSRGGTVPLVADLTRVTQLASAGVRALYEVSKQLAAHGQKLVLITAPGSVAHTVLDLVRLDHVSPEAIA